MALLTPARQVRMLSVSLPTGGANEAAVSVR